jgi:hypothetical protein
MRRLLLTSVVVLALLLVVAPAAGAARRGMIDFAAFTTLADLTAGTADGVVATPAYGDGAVVLGDGVDKGSWTSATHVPGVPVTFLVASWETFTPPGSQVDVRLKLLVAGQWTKWYVMGRWTLDDADFQRTSVGGQGDADGYVAVDTWIAKAKPATAYKLKVVLARAPSGASPVVRQVAATGSDPRNPKPFIPSVTTMTAEFDLAVPEYSQMVHAGHFPEYDGGGEAWCSPASTAMLMGYWGPGPSVAALAAFPGLEHPDPWVDHAARFVYDYRYQGCGNWPFNAAYASEYGYAASVRQFKDLREAEAWVTAGVPLAASIAANPNKLTGFPFKFGTSGHLLVIRGFTATGDVIVNDPAAPDDASVQRVYDRTEFERAWLVGSAGVVYVIHDPYWVTP